MERFITNNNLIHIVGFTVSTVLQGLPITTAKQSLGIALAREQFEGAFFKQGGILPGVLKHPKALRGNAVKNIKESWGEYLGADRAHQWPVLEEGMEVQQLSMWLVDMEFTALKNLTRANVAVLLNLPPAYLAASTSNTLTYATVESNQIQFAQFTIAPIVNAIAKALAANRSCSRKTCSSRVRAGRAPPRQHEVTGRVLQDHVQHRGIGRRRDPGGQLSAAPRQLPAPELPTAANATVARNRRACSQRQRRADARRPHTGGITYGKRNNTNRGGLAVVGDRRRPSCGPCRSSTSNAASDGSSFDGYAAVFDNEANLSKLLNGNNNRSGGAGGSVRFTESVSRGAFRKVLASPANVPMLWNHNPNYALATTKASTFDAGRKQEKAWAKDALGSNFMADRRGGWRQGQTGCPTGSLPSRIKNRASRRNHSPHCSDSKSCSTSHQPWDPAYAGTSAELRAAASAAGWPQEILNGEGPQIEEAAANPKSDAEEQRKLSGHTNFPMWQRRGGA